MKKLVKSVITVGILSISISASAFGADLNKSMHSNMAMSHENMEKMHSNMLAMKAQVFAVKQENDPKKQQELMHKHRKSMIKMMQIMHRKMADKPIEQQINMAEHHIKMMEGMMPNMGSAKMTDKNSSNKHNH